MKHAYIDLSLFTAQIQKKEKKKTTQKKKKKNEQGVSHSPLMKTKAF